MAFADTWVGLPGVDAWIHLLSDEEEAAKAVQGYVDYCYSSEVLS